MLPGQGDVNLILLGLSQSAHKGSRESYQEEYLQMIREILGAWSKIFRMLFTPLHRWQGPVRDRMERAQTRRPSSASPEPRRKPAELRVEGIALTAGQRYALHRIHLYQTHFKAKSRMAPVRRMHPMMRTTIVRSPAAAEAPVEYILNGEPHS